MEKKQIKPEPDSSAVRTALWRAVHKLVDSTPYIIDDDIGLKLIAPNSDWRDRGDMHPIGTRGYRAAIIARARLIEDLVEEQFKTNGIDQYVILGAGLDTFAQRRPELLSKIKVFEIDKPSASLWKKQRLVELNYGIPENLKLIPVDFEMNESWVEKLIASGFDPKRPAIITATGVTMYLTQEANISMLKEIKTFAPGSIAAITFTLTLDLLPEEERPKHEMVYQRAREAGTPFLSFFKPEEMLNLARKAGFKEVKHVSTEDEIERYFQNRSDGLLPAKGEEFIIATI